MSLKQDASNFFSYKQPEAVECTLKFNRYMPFEDTAILVRQPDLKQDVYQVLFEDAYGNYNAELMSKEGIEHKYKITL